MSQTITRIPRSQALAISKLIVNLLTPVCERIEIAGSLRRGKPDVGDIEIVCIPAPEYDLFSGATRTANRIETVLRCMPMWSVAKNGQNFKQIDLGPCNLDLFITTPEQWGVIYLIRTGSSSFSKNMVTQRYKGGLLPSNLYVSDGRIWCDGYPLETPEEIDFFRICGLEFVPPENRV